MANPIPAPHIIRLEDLTPDEQQAFVDVRRSTEEALRVAHLMVDLVDNDGA